jgi:subtilisin family serine protease
MHPARHAAIGALGSFCLIGAAAAAEMTGAEIKDLISGRSVYLELTAASATGTPGQGVIYYAPDGTELYRTAKGATWHGIWSIKGNTLCNDWKEAPNNPCTKYDKQGDTITVIVATTGQIRGKILKIAAGNAEKIAP